MKRLACLLALCSGCIFTSRPMLPLTDDASVGFPTDEGRTPTTDAPVTVFDVSAPTDALVPPPQDAPGIDAGTAADVSASSDTAPAFDAPRADTESDAAFDASADDRGPPTPCTDPHRDGSVDADADAPDDARSCDSDAGDASDGDVPDAGDATDAGESADR